MRKILVCLQVVILVCIMQQALSAPVILNSEENYLVQGTNVQEVLTLINTEGPIVDGKRFSAVTEARVSWTVQYTFADDKCSLTNIQVTDTTRYVFPVWANYQDAAPEVRQVWDKSIALLKQHERKHGENSLLAANAVEDMLQHLPAMENCDVLKDVASKNTDAIIQQFKDKDVAYDSVTEHGTHAS